MIINIFILLFLIGMILVWAHYGFFSAFLHCLFVILAGAISFALWEPLAQGILLHRMPSTAWGVGLLGPFVLMLIAFHLVIDRVAGANVNFPDIVNKLGGAVFGLLAGTLTAGLLVLGLSFMALPVSLAGYQRFSTLGSGQVDVANPSQLWIPVDDIAAGFFSGLSAGAFSTRTPMAIYQPDLATQAGLYRMRIDPYSSTAIIPGSVDVEAVYVHPTLIESLDPQIAEALGPRFEDKTSDLVVVVTNWRKVPGTYDPDSTLRIPPSQVQLVTAKKQGGGWSDVRLVEPVAFRGKSDTTHNQPYLHPIDSDTASAFGFNDQEQVTFVFLVEQDTDPVFLMARHVRLPLPRDPNPNAGALIAALGEPVPSAQAAAGPGGQPKPPADSRYSDGAVIGPDGTEFVITRKLPLAVSKNDALSLNHDDNENQIKSGEATAKKMSRVGTGPRTRLTEIASPTHKPLVRMRLKGEDARGHFGARDTAVNMTKPIFLTDDQGNVIQPMGVVWLKSDNSQYIHVKSGGQTFATGGQIGIIPRMKSGEDLFLYFQVTTGNYISSYTIAGQEKQALAAPMLVE